MQATKNVRTDAPTNEDQFGDPFFKRFTLADRSFELEPGLTKSYPFPTLYGDVGCAIGIFLCDWEAARAMMPHPSILPVRMTRGRTLVIFSCYQYRQVLKVWPYNEIAMTIPVMANAGFRPPVLPMLMSGLFPRFGYYVFGMPVTSRENQLRGNKLWGLPKVTQSIDQEIAGDVCITTARDSDEKPYFTLTVPTHGTPTDFDVRGNLYSKLDGKILQSQTCFKGRFAVTKNMGNLFAKNAPADRTYLTIGDSPAAKPLVDLQIEPKPFQTRYCPSMNAAFGLPSTDFSIDS